MACSGLFAVPEQSDTPPADYAVNCKVSKIARVRFNVRKVAKSALLTPAQRSHKSVVCLHFFPCLSAACSRRIISLAHTVMIDAYGIKLSLKTKSDYVKHEPLEATFFFKTVRISSARLSLGEIECVLIEHCFLEHAASISKPTCLGWLSEWCCITTIYITFRADSIVTVSLA